MELSKPESLREKILPDIFIKERIINLDDVKPEMDKTFKEGKRRGEPTHFHPIDEFRMFTWKKGFLYCITGNPGSGKSELLNMLTLLKSLHDNRTWTIYSPESYPIEDFLDTLIHTLVGKSTDPKYPNQMSKAHYDKAFEFVKSKYRIIDFTDMPTISDIIEADKKKKTDGLIIDPFNSLDDEGQNPYNFLKNGLTKLKQYARENNKYVVCVEHPHSAHSLDDDGNPREPSEYTLSGGKMWHNKCDVIGVVHRPLKHSDPKDTHVTFRTRKIKNQKLNGFEGYCEINFDRESNRYFYRDEKGFKKTGFKNE